MAACGAVGRAPHGEMTTVTIERLAAGGDGVGRLADGRVVFVPRTAPGDIVEVEVVLWKPRYARARLLAVASPGEGRVTPHCKHYVEDQCGGCQLQHLDLQTQLAVKRRIVGDALRRIGKLDIPDPDIVPAVDPWRYRTKLTLAARTEGPRPMLGLHSYLDPASLFEPDDCPITCQPVVELWRRVGSHREFLPPGVRSLVLRQDRKGGRHVIVGTDAQPWDPRPLTDALADTGLSIWWGPAGGAVRIVSGPRTGFPALAFEQSNAALAARIRCEATDGLEIESGDIAWDLYGGVGDTAVLLAERGARVWSVDADRTAKAWARSRAPGARLAITHVSARVEETFHRLPSPRAVVVNPPRAGLSRRVAHQLAELARRGTARRMAYISCDPATLARDLQRMPSWTPSRVVAFDLFPQTSHVETLVMLEAA